MNTFRMTIMLATLTVMAVIIAISNNPAFAQCEKVSDSPLAPCKEVTELRLDHVSFDVVVEDMHCVPYLTYHGDFSELNTAVSARKVDVTHYSNRESGLVHLYHFTRLSNGLDNKGERDVIPENIGSAQIRLGFSKHTKSDLLRSFPKLGEPSLYNYVIEAYNRPAYIYTAGDVQRSFGVRIRQEDSGNNSYTYFVQTSFVPNAPELTDIESQFVQCVRGIERIEESAQNAQILSKAQQGANVQKQIAEADVAFYNSEIEKISSAITQLETTLAEATASYEEALTRQRDLITLQQRHAQIIDQFFADKGESYTRFQAWADDRFAAIQAHAENIERSQAAIQSMIDEFETLRQETQDKLDAAIAELSATQTQLVFRPGARFGYSDSEKWGTTDDMDKALDHIECFYDATAKRVVLISMPNIQIDDNGRCSCGCLEKLLSECDRVSHLHQRINPGKKNTGEKLIVHIGANGTSWRMADHPLIVVASNRVSIKLDGP